MSDPSTVGSKLLRLPSTKEMAAAGIAWDDVDGELWEACRVGGEPHEVWTARDL